MNACLEVQNPPCMSKPKRRALQVTRAARHGSEYLSCLAYGAAGRGLALFNLWREQRAFMYHTVIYTAPELAL